MDKDTKQAIDFFKKCISGKPDMSLWDACRNGIIYLPPVYNTKDLPLYANEGDCINVLDQPAGTVKQTFIYDGDTWKSLDMFNPSAPNQFLSPNSEHLVLGDQKISKFDALVARNDVINTITNASSTPSMQTIINEIFGENKELKKELQEIKQKISSMGHY